MRVVERIRARLRRRHYTRAELDVPNWPHPRPSRDSRLICLHIALTWSSLLQTWLGPAPASAQGQSFGVAALAAFAMLLIVSTALMTYAAFCRSQYWSFGTECAGCVGYAAVFVIYGAALMMTQDQWFRTTPGWFAPLLAIGYGIRATILGRRILP